MKKLAQFTLAGLGAFALLQFVRPSIPTQPAAREIAAPPEVRQILNKDCFSCHSDERRLAWFDEVVPAYWLVRHDVLTARKHLDFSTLGSKPPAAQRAALFEAVNMIQLGAMPLPQFVQLHPEARVTPEELATLKSYLDPWAPLKTVGAAAGVAISAPVNLATVQPELNGLPFDPAFENWKLLSVTDRGDNNTFRFILGNDVAVKAAQAGNISPWPDGSRFAKIAWQKSAGSDGLVRPGGFVQVELMVKDAARYKQTDDWGWGRWRGAELKPYGDDARFVNECTGCHKPVRGNDSVYTLPITRAVVHRDEVVNNRAAVDEKLLPLDWNPITLYVDPATRTMAVLFGNDTAMRAVRTRAVHDEAAIAYPEDAALALVTWAQRDDPHWFGARIPDAPESVELLQVGSTEGGSVYRRFNGDGQIDTQAGTQATERTKFMLGLAPAQLP